MDRDDMVRVPGGMFRMGSDRHYPEEAPAHRVTVAGFLIDRHPVTNRQFREFIDRITKEGLMFTDYYAEQSCTDGTSSFITGQAMLRTGLSKVGIPGATIGLQAGDITVAAALKPLGYATGQFGKNHLGDRNEYLPTVHGFDEFLGNLYHLNAEEDPEDPDYPKDPRFRARFGPRGVLKCTATDIDDPRPGSRQAGHRFRYRE
jgi:arylsulfatase A-like enzyme